MIWFNSKQFLTQTLQGARLIGSLTRSQARTLIRSFSKKEIIRLLSFGVVLVIAIISLAASSNGSSDGKADFGGEVIEGLVGQPRFINPVLAAASSTDSDLTKIAFAQLLKFDKNLQLVPDLAESLPAISADQKTYTLKLKPNLKWQDGKPLLAEDVLFTISAIQNPDFESPLRANWSRVKAEKSDDLTLTFQLREVSASFLTNFTLAVLPKHIWDGKTPNSFRLSDDNLKPVGSGPFAVREIKKTSDGEVLSITFRANDLYHEGRPYLDRMSFKFFDDFNKLIQSYQGRDVTTLGFIPFDKRAFLDKNDRFKQYQISLPQYSAVFFNLPKNVVLADKAVRQALWLTSNRAKIVDEVYLGFAKESFGPILPGNLGYNEEVAKKTHISLDEAKAILDKGGWVVDPATNVRVKNKRPLQFTLATNNFILNAKTAQELKTQWEHLGAQIDLAIVSSADLEQNYIRPRNFDALLFAENTGADPDPFAFWHSSQSRDPGLNFSGFSNAEVDKLLTSARQTNDTNVRAKNYEQFQTIVLGEIPAIFLNSAVFVYHTPQKLQGIDLQTIIHPSERFLDIKNWYIK